MSTSPGRRCLHAIVTRDSLRACLSSQVDPKGLTPDGIAHLRPTRSGPRPRTS